jgi:hypothetical protein
LRGDRKPIYVVGVKVFWHVDVREKSDLEKKTTWKKKKKAYIVSGLKIILPSENGG